MLHAAVEVALDSDNFRSALRELVRDQFCQQFDSQFLELSAFAASTTQMFEDLVERHDKLSKELVVTSQRASAAFTMVAELSSQIESNGKMRHTAVVDTDAVAGAANTAVAAAAAASSARLAARALWEALRSPSVADRTMAESLGVSCELRDAGLRAVQPTATDEHHEDLRQAELQRRACHTTGAQPEPEGLSSY